MSVSPVRDFIHAAPRLNRRTRHLLQVHNVVTTLLFRQKLDDEDHKKSGADRDKPLRLPRNSLTPAEPFFNRIVSAFGWACCPGL